MTRNDALRLAYDLFIEVSRASRYSTEREAEVMLAKAEAAKGLVALAKELREGT